MMTGKGSIALATWIFLLALGACRPKEAAESLAVDESVNQAALADDAAADTIAVDALSPEPDFLSSPAPIEAWVRFIDGKLPTLEKKGPYTIPRLEGNYEVTAYLGGGEIVLLYCQLPGGRAQQWYHLNRYLVPRLREVGVDETGRYYERRFYYAGTDRRLAARERVAGAYEELESAGWRQYRSTEAGDFRMLPEEVRAVALKFIAGE